MSSEWAELFFLCVSAPLREINCVFASLRENNKEASYHFSASLREINCVLASWRED
jgi:hypothetical protein